MDQVWAGAAERMKEPEITSPFLDTVEPSALNPLVAAWFADLLLEDEQRKQAYQMLFDLMETRVDKQIGSAPNNSGTTSLAMKGAAPAILGFAVENGGLERSVSGTTVTFRGNPYGLVNAIRGRGFLEMFESLDRAASSTAFQRVSSLLSFAVSFDTSRGQTPGALLADRQQLASWSVRFQPVNRRDSRQRAYVRQFARLSESDEARAFRDSRDELDKAFEEWPGLRDWRRNLQEKVERRIDLAWQQKKINPAAAEAEFREIVTQEFPRLTVLLRGDPTPPLEVERALDLYVRRLTRMLERRTEIREYALKGELFTIDYTVTRDPNIPDTSHLTFIFETSLGQSRLHDLTVNAGVNFLNSAPRAVTDAGRFRDFKLTAQYEIPLANLQRTGAMTFSFAGMYQFIPDDTFAPGSRGLAAPLAALRGHVAVFQAKLTIPVEGSGIRIPISFTTSNRTELIREKDVRANFGVTFDFDSIFARAFSR